MEPATPLEASCSSAQTVVTESTQVRGALRSDGRAARDSSPKLLIVAWEYPGVSSRQGTALARRVGQLARGFARHGWCVDVMYRSLTGSPSNVESPDGVTLHGISSNEKSPRTNRTTVGRRLATAWYGAVHGDRSGPWARLAQARLTQFDTDAPDLVIGCFTPRATLTVARAAALRWSIPWIADLQDPALEGSRGSVAPLVRRWMRRTLASAAAVVQVSPEWAKADAALLNREVLTLRHAVPVEHSTTTARKEASRDKEFVLLYAGSLIGTEQSPQPLMSALDRLSRTEGRRVVLRVACNDATRQMFERSLQGEAHSWFQPLGWLAKDDLMNEIDGADCLVLIPSNEAERPVVPSKLYEYMAYDRPVLIAGQDSGAVSSLLAEWQHSNVIHGSTDTVVMALDRARSGDPSLLLQRSACARQPMDEEQLAERYIELASALHTGPVR